MEPYEPAKLENLFLKAVWNNIIQIAVGLLVLVLVIIKWDSTEAGIKVGIFIMTFAYFMIRFSVAYQSHRFEQDIEEQKKGKADDTIYEDKLKKG